MAVLDPVVIRFGAARVAGKTMALTELLEVVAAACDELVHVGLWPVSHRMTSARAFEDPVQRDGQFNGRRDSSQGDRPFSRPSSRRTRGSRGRARQVG